MEDHVLHAGTILRQKRTELGLSIGDVSRLTGIRTAIIEAIEAGAFDIMPAVYMRSFIRRYARAVGINERELPPVEGTTVQRKTAPVTQAKATTNPSTRRASPVVVVVLAIAIVGAAGYALFHSTEAGTSSPEPADKAETPIETVRTTPSRGLLEYFGSPQSDSLLRLEAVAIDTVWMSLTMDGRRSEQIMLYPGDRRQWNASATIVISLGNAGGVELYRNGQRLAPLGKRGEAVRYVRITPTDVIPSTSSWSRRRDSLLETLQHQPPPAVQPSQRTTSTSVTAPAAPKQHSSQPSRSPTTDRRRQELLRRAMQSREITPVPPKAPLPTSSTKPSSP